MDLQAGDALRGLKGDMRLTAQRIELIAKGGRKADGDKIATTPKGSRIPRSVPVAKTPKQRGTTDPRRRHKPIAKRPAGYTWNKGGRLKEIRIRTRARKFLLLWRAKTFGRVLPSTADAYFEKRVVRNTFKEWKMMWWEARVEWKLLVRAEYHHRYSLYSLVWLQWRAYTTRQRDKSTKWSKAVAHWGGKTSRLYFRNWGLYLRLRRTKKSMYDDARGIVCKNLTKRTWRTWQERIKNAKQVKVNHETALLHWMSVAQRKTWQKWFSVYSHKKRMRLLNLKAVNHYNHCIQHRCLSSWVHHRNGWKEKQTSAQFANRIRNRALAGVSLNAWYTRWKRVVAIREKRHIIEEMSQRSLMRRAIVAWYFFIELRRTEHQNFTLAESHHRQHMLRRSLHTMAFQATLGRKKAYMHRQAMVHHHRQVLQKAWTLWQQRVEKVEDQRLSDLTEIAREHHKVNVMDSMWKQWAAYIRWRQNRKQQVVRADSHFIVRVLPVCFKIWKRYVLNSRKKKRRLEKAETFWINTSYSKVFYTWWINFDQCREHRTLERIAILHSREVSLKRNFVTWKRKTKEKIIASRVATNADLCYREILLKRTFSSWKRLLDDGRAKRQKIIRAATHYYCSAVSGAWVSWRTFVAQHRSKHVRNDKADQYSRKILTTKFFERWRKRHVRLKALEAEALKRRKIKEKATLCLVLAHWKAAADRMAVEKEKLKKARQHYAQRVHSKTLQRWRLWSAMHHHQRAQKEDRLCDIQKQLQRKQTKRILHRWKHATAVSRIERYKNAIAHDHYKLRVCNISLQAWKLYWYTQTKKTLMAEQASHFSEKRLTVTCFTKWKSYFELRNEENKKTCDALWHWAFALQSKVLTAWIAYVNERNRKKSRYNEAMQRRRLYLLRKGCRKMLESHADDVKVRMQIGATQKALSTYAGYHLAWKFAKRWRSITLENREKRNSPSPMLPTNLGSLLENPMLHPIPGKGWHTQTNAKSNDLNEESWILEPKPQPAARSPDRSGTCRSFAHEQHLQGRQPRPQPRGPDFLMDSLQREGLDEEIECTHTQKQVRFAPAEPALYDVTSQVNGDHHGQATEDMDIVAGHTATIPKKFNTINPDQSMHFAPLHMLKKAALVHEVSSNQRPPTSVAITSKPIEPLMTPALGQADLVLLPPSAFTCALESDHHQLHLSPRQDTKDDDLDEDVASESLPTSCSSQEEEDFSEKETSPQQWSKNVPSGNVLTPPQRISVPVQTEIKQIRKELQEYQLRKEELRALKHQKELLEEWLSRQQARPAADCSVFGPAQDELLQITEDLKSIAEELKCKRPHIEKLAMRVKALSSGSP